MSQIEGRSLFRRRGCRQALVDVNIVLNKGQLIGLFGSNGSGKTTLLFLIAGLLSPDAGKIFLNGEDITRLAIHNRSRRGISYLAQEPSVFRHLTVKENLDSVLEWRKDLTSAQKKEKRDKVIESLDLVKFANQRSDTLSGGQRRRTEVARSLMGDPHFFLLDEPFSGVDPRSVQEIIEILFKLKKLGMGIFITDHNVREALPLTDHAYILHEGYVLAHGTKIELVENKTVKDVYLGKGFSL